MKLRVFVSIAISEKLQNEIADWRLNFLGKNPGAFFDLRWLADKNLHITLIPPWYEDEHAVEKVKSKMQQAISSVAPFEIEFNKVTYGPDQRRPRLIWGEGKAPQELLDLKSGLEKILDKKPERREFTLHLTLARFRPENFRYFSLKKLDEKILWRDTVRSIVLMESFLSPTGADYEVLAEVKF